jgi:hypothetical protein
MDVDTLEDDHIMKKAKQQQVDKLSNNISRNLHLDPNNNPIHHHKGKNKEIIPIPKEENILVLMERMSKNKEMRSNKECMDNIANLLQQRFDLSAKLESHRSCDNS